ncbi:hypothetical protein Cyrtocomes_01214 [Candidatus Cyrtobacter comes]|uniref:Uncharacterized protein n=1 Tax=Candidatus Cyrtobacter comes TaxID=675776 RepID=A0ABU5LAD4_9RICK|nr:hypothetical protein [Candidatus Cyrtobacter comes]
MTNKIDNAYKRISEYANQFKGSAINRQSVDNRHC